jgi:hypothetical protein
MLSHKPVLHRPQKVPVQSRIHEQNQHLLYLIPDVVNIDKRLVDRWNDMRRDPDTEYGNVDSGNEGSGAPFYVANCAAVLGDQSDTVDDDLHEELDLEDPKEEDEEENRNAVMHRQYTLLKPVH